MFSNINPRNNRVTAAEQLAFRRCRLAGMTLQWIASNFGRTVTTVYRHTKCIPHECRHNKTVVMNRRTGR